MMTAEWVTALATAGTFFVIFASAIAALRQLGHMRSTTQITAITESRETLESPEFQAAQHFVSFELPKRLKNPAEARKISVLPFAEEYRAIGTIANFFETMGLFVKAGIIDEQIACDVWGWVILRNWNALLPVTTYVRRATTPALWENFEYLAFLSEKFQREHPVAYPPNVPRMPEDTSLCDLVDADGGGGAA